jgi:hypothetical protein
MEAILCGLRRSSVHINFFRVAARVVEVALFFVEFGVQLVVL